MRRTDPTAAPAAPTPPGATGHRTSAAPPAHFSGRHRLRTALLALALLPALAACDDDDDGQTGDEDASGRADGARDPDLALPDLATPDRGRPDATPTDAARPDLAAPDAAPDLARPDAAPDLALPDAEPDLAVDAEPDAQPDLGRVPCDSDAQCGALDYCDLARQVCVPGCRFGVGTCSVGTACDADRQCSDAQCGPAEICGNADDEDCDGVVDEADACPTVCVAGAPCQTEQFGRCGAGAIECPAGPFAAGRCVPTQAPSAEICGNADDEDCDGVVDEADACPVVCVAGAPCQTELFGPCAGGTLACPAGPFAAGTCAPTVAPVDELCGNGGDEDCDGVADEADACPLAARCQQDLVAVEVAPARLSPAGVRAERPAAAQSDTHYGVAWYEPERGAVVFGRYTEGGALDGPPQVFADGAPRDPAVAWHAGGWTLLYAAFDADSGSRRIFRQRLTPDGAPLAPAEVIAEGQPDAARPSLAQGASGRLAAAWYVGDGPNRRLRLADLSADPSAPFDAGAADGVAGQTPHPAGLAVAFNAAANADQLGVLAFIDFQNTLDLRIYRLDGGLATPAVRLANGAAFGGALAFALNRYLAAWPELFGTQARIVGTAGELPVPAATVFDNGRLPGALAFDGAGFGLANVIEDVAGRDLAFRPLDGVGAGASRARRVLARPDTRAWRPTLLHDAARGFALVWEEEDTDAGVAEVWFTRGPFRCPE